ncbi:hypothetical protein D8B26_005534 [Coccidioides posadasii str. Silveira]|uniref:Uncharacterized protein n=1 Tax=Coccidioides posadasii (strain RMSCC 757 / Silveira) TaxID=443226 RepID=E9D3S3_COCPS|nr:hypothetical protein CPSG_04262 [Coccidioides posadasii str. Silveira]QVM10883.1 hypothetical protein D8B26_005534 [Coccidioides posadasii str. Silveira]
MTDLRQRAKNRPLAEAGIDRQESSEPLRKQIRAYDEESNTISVLDIFRFLCLILIASLGLSYFLTGDSITWGFKPWFTRWSVLVRRLRGPVLLTPSELSLYNGTSPDLPIYISVNHTIYDVSASPHLYGPGGGYSFFAGRDATRAFITGCFQDDLTSDLSGVEEMFIPIEDDDESEAEQGMTRAEKKMRREREMREAKSMVEKQVKHWVQFYEKSHKYFSVGRVVTEDGGKIEENGGKKRELCDEAKKGRPKRSNLREEKEKKAKKKAN